MSLQALAGWSALVLLVIGILATIDNYLAAKKCQATKATGWFAIHTARGTAAKAKKG